MAILALSVSLSIAGCSGKSAETINVEPNADSYAESEQQDADLGKGEAPADEQWAEESKGNLSSFTSMLVTTGDASVVTDKPDAAMASLAEHVKSVGGRIEKSNQETVDGQQVGSLTARVPADKFDETVAQLGELGEIEYQSTESEDVGLQVSDLEGRKTALQASAKRLEELIEEAGSTEAVISSEAELTNRQAELESLQSQLNYLNDQVSMSTLKVTFHSPDYSSPSSPEGLWGAFLQSAETMGYAVVTILPWAVVATLIGFTIRLGLKAHRRGRANRSISK